MSDPGQPEGPGSPHHVPRGSNASTPMPWCEPGWSAPGSGDAVIAVGSTGAVIVMNLTAVSLLGLPAPHQLGLGLGQFVPTRYQRVIDAWSVREDGDARAAHQDALTLSLAALQADGGEVPVLLTRRMLAEGPNAPYVVTMRAVVASRFPIVPPVPVRVRLPAGLSSPTEAWDTSR